MTEAAVSVPVDESDPVVAAIAWGLTYLVSQIPDERMRYVRPALPILAVGIAVVARAIIDDGFSAESVARGLAAGCAAVMAHSQTREIAKRVTTPPPAP